MNRTNSIVALLTVIAVLLAMNLLLIGTEKARAEPAEGQFGCCLPNDACIDVAEVLDCVMLGGVLQPSICDGGPCGACCLDGGCAAPVHETACMDFQADASWFAVEDCDTACLPGACCIPGGDCEITPSAGFCEDLYSGDFQGFDTNCEDVDCPVCPSDITGDGIIGFADVLQILADWGPCP